MEARERENAARAARGGKLLPMAEQWVNRPRLLPPEQEMFFEFMRFHRFCGGDPRPPDARAWFEMRRVPAAEQEWLAVVFAAMAGALREKRDDQ